ncbi:MAG: DUF1330 domain-containing protein [Gammaproteobacteria bacterium]|nr:DUF1330 domain-containing protein [Gammaproteobacteria bacterium]
MAECRAGAIVAARGRTTRLCARQRSRHRRHRVGGLRRGCRTSCAGGGNQRGGTRRDGECPRHGSAPKPVRRFAFATRRARLRPKATPTSRATNTAGRCAPSSVCYTGGEWPYAEGFVAIETFRSMDDFTAFWNSPGYQEAIELRKGKVELDFVVALEGLPDSP